MMHDTEALATMQNAALLPRIPRRVQRAVDAQAACGLVRAARAQADAYVAHTRIEGASFVARTGLARVAELSAEEVRYSAQTPLAESRFRAITDSFAALVNREVLSLGYGR